MAPRTNVRVVCPLSGSWYYLIFILALRLSTSSHKRNTLYSVSLRISIYDNHFQEYDVLEFFWYALQNEDFDNKWEAVGWPYKIQLQIDETETLLKEEEEVFYKLQIKDEFELRDKTETLTAQVVQISQWKDFEKVSEISKTKMKYNFFMS